MSSVLIDSRFLGCVLTPDSRKVLPSKLSPWGDTGGGGTGNVASTPLQSPSSIGRPKYLKVQAPEGVGGGRSGAVRVKELPHKRQGDSEGVLAFVTS